MTHSAALASALSHIDNMTDAQAVIDSDIQALARLAPYINCKKALQESYPDVYAYYLEYDPDYIETLDMSTLCYELAKHSDIELEIQEALAPCLADNS